MFTAKYNVNSPDSFVPDGRTLVGLGISSTGEHAVFHRSYLILTNAGNIRAMEIAVVILVTVVVVGEDDVCDGITKPRPGNESPTRDLVRFSAPETVM